jgi:D-alanine-D-alanine ligase
MFVLELNTIPGLTAQSLLPKSAVVAGYPWHKLVAKFVELASN